MIHQVRVGCIQSVNECRKWIMTKPSRLFCEWIVEISKRSCAVYQRKRNKKRVLNLKRSDKLCKNIRQLLWWPTTKVTSSYSNSKTSVLMSVWFLSFPFMPFWTGRRPLSLFVAVTSVSLRKILNYLLTQKVQKSHKLWLTFQLGHHALLKMLINLKKKSLHESEVHTYMFTAL